jgi:hypothetical protein
MEPAAYDELERTLSTEGAPAAIDRLCARLRDEGDYGALFYALLMKKRHQLGVNPVPTGAAHDLPEEHHQAYEDAIREAGRLVGKLYLDNGNLPQAWTYYRMLNESAPVRAALESYQAGEDEDVQPLVQIAFYEGVHPRKGFEWVLQRYGLCSAITTLSGQEGNQAPEDRSHCIRTLVRALYRELRERIAADVERRQGELPPEAKAPADAGGVVRKLLAGRDWLFEDDFYHVDVSHLSSVVQMSINLSACPELELARELCEYGRRLSPRFQNPSEPPFERPYEAFAAYLAVLAGDKVDENLAYFQRKVEENDPNEFGTFPAEVYVNLLLKIGRDREALAVARKYLAGVTDRRLTCPTLPELCRKAGDFRTLAEVAREHNDPVHFVAGLLAAQR